MNIIPNLFVTGVLTLIVSLTILDWVIVFVQRKDGGWGLILFSIAMLLEG